MDYKYIEQLMERYWAAETTLEEEHILHTFFRQKDIPAEMERLRPLFAWEAALQEQRLDDDFDEKILAMTMGSEAEHTADAPVVVKAREVTLQQRLMPFFKAAAVVAIVLTLGNAAQAPWDAAWNDPRDYARNLQDADTVTAIRPIQAENISDVAADSAKVLLPGQSKD